MSKDAVDRLRENSQNESTVIVLSQALKISEALIAKQRGYIERLELSLQAMVDMINAGDEHGRGSPWRINAVKALASKPKELT